MNLDDITKISDLTYEMISRATLSFINKEKEDTLWVIQSDVVVNKLNRHITRNSILAEEVLEEMYKAILDYSAIRIIISSIERIADHATHIAEASIFASAGEDIRRREVK